LSALFGDPEQKRIKLQIDFDYVTTKVTMQDKLTEIGSRQQKSKEHEVFEDF